MSVSQAGTTRVKIIVPSVIISKFNRRKLKWIIQRNAWHFTQPSFSLKFTMIKKNKAII